MLPPRHYYRSLDGRWWCACGLRQEHPRHQGVTGEDDAEYVEFCKSNGIDLDGYLPRAELASTPQPPSKPGTTNIIDLVHADLDARDRMGTKKYGTTLQAHNGRKPLVDAYQEALDQAMYLRQEIEERRGPTAQDVIHAVAREFGWRTDWATGSPIELHHVIDELRKRVSRQVTQQQLVTVIATVSEQARRDLQMEPDRYIEQLSSAILKLING